MNTFLKRNRMIKLFTVSWLFLMIVIATFLLLGASPMHDRDTEAIFIPEEGNLEVTVIGLPLSALLNQVVIVNSSCSMKAAALTLMSGKIYKFEVWGVVNNNSISYRSYSNDIPGKSVYAYGWYDMRGKAQRTAYCSINIIFAGNNSYHDQTEKGYSDYEGHDNVATFISIGGYDISCAVIIAGGSRESAEESTNGDTYVNDSSVQDSDSLSYIGGVVDLDVSNPAGIVIQDDLASNGKMVIKEYDVAPVYTVIFDMNGIGDSAPARQSILQGGMVMQPDDPVYMGWTFEGWFNDQACTAQWNFNTDTVYAATILYAKWTPNFVF
ncbi:MAG: InlB B-repeat-containing protein [Leptospirales bacterium]|nr:InlB B-repeat-containing protein [Leptospirales bacterium]